MDSTQMITQQQLFPLPQLQGETSDEWYTPPKIIEAARRVFGVIDLDPASSRAAQLRVKATTFYTIHDDGLSQLWAGSVWLNGPYSNLLPWMQKLKYEYCHTRNVPAYITLVPERLGIQWFNLVRDMSCALCMLDERVRFLRADERESSSPNFGNIVFYGGKYPMVFKREFKPLGKVWVE